MPEQQLSDVIRYIRRIASTEDEVRTDRELLAAFAARNDEAAFTAMVKRHGPMVMGICRRVLHHLEDAEDAFQATFLLLARRSTGIRKQESLASWLHGVAYRMAHKAKQSASRRRKYEGTIPPAQSDNPTAALEWREVQAILDDEIQRLPETYRIPFILFYLENRKQADIAHQLGIKEGTVWSRLAHARRLLQERLSQRGVALPAVLGLLAVSAEAALATVPPLLAASAVKMALQAAAAGIPASMMALVEGVMHKMVLSKLRITFILTLIAVGIGAGALVYQTSGKQSIEEQAESLAADGFAIGDGIDPPAAEQPPPPAKVAEKRSRTDLYGDPLPPGALARLGTIRLRHISAAVAFSPDGITLLSAGADGTIRYWEPATGKEKRQVRVQAGGSYAHPQIFAADGKTVAGLTAKGIHVWDTTTGKELKRFPLEKYSIPGLENRLAQVWRLALSPDGKMLAVLFDDYKDRNLHLWNVNTGKRLFTLKLRRLRDSLAFSSDGKLLGTASYNEGLQLWDTVTGKEVRKIAGAQNYLAFAPDGKRVAAVSRGGDVKVWNMADGKEVFDLKPVPGRYPGSLAFAPDSKTLAISFPEELLFCDVASGKQLRTIPGWAGRLAFSPDGKTAATSGTAIHVWDLTTGKEIGLRAGHRSAVTALAIAPDGGSIATFDINPSLHLWDPASGKHLLQVAAHKGYVRSGAFSPDGRFLVTGGGDTTIRSWDCKTGAEVRKFPIESRDPVRENLQVMALALSSDGERLVSLVIGGDALSTYQLHVWDFVTGKRLARRVPTHAGFGTRFSLDARSMADHSGEEVIVADVVTGQEIVKTAGRAPLAFSPDGQILAVANFQPKPLPPGTAGPAGGIAGEMDAICLVELATGKKLLRIETGPVGHNLLAFSPDGRTLATADQDSFRIWDAATGKELFRRALPEKYRGSFGYSFVSSLAFLPDSGRLATGLMDSTVLIWDLESKKWHTGIPVQELASRDLERLWADLAGEDAAKAYQAEWTLAAAPARAVPFLKAHLRPAAALDAKQVEDLIHDLDNAEFAVREAAEKKLTSFAEQAEPALRQALEGKPSLEACKRLEALHSNAEMAGRSVVRSAEVVRGLRAIRVLEHIGDQEARQLLQKLASGDPAARTTRQAKEALQRLQHRAAGRDGMGGGNAFLGDKICDRTLGH